MTANSRTEKDALMKLEPAALSVALTRAEQAPHFYAVLRQLGNAPTLCAASADAQIRAAWLAAMRSYHPDRAAHTTPLAQTLCGKLAALANTAYAAVCAAAPRRAYNTLLRGRGAVVCSACKGAGAVRAKTRGPDAKLHYVDAPCLACDGAGLVVKARSAA